MNEYMMLIAVLLPIVLGVPIHLYKFKSAKIRNIYTEIVVIATSILVFALVANPPQGMATFFRFTMDLSVTLKLDGL